MDKIRYIINSIYNIFKMFENCIVIPVKKVLTRCNPIIHWYKKRFYNYTHDKYGDFVYKKAFLRLLYDIIYIYLAYCILEFTFDTVYFLSTKKIETIYLSDSVELDSDKSIWGVKGCPTKECDSDTALYFRIKWSWFNQVWNIIYHGKIFFADGIAAGVPTGQTECEVLSYGLRYRILMIYNYYPQILQVKCEASS